MRGEKHIRLAVAIVLSVWVLVLAGVIPGTSSVGTTDESASFASQTETLADPASGRGGDSSVTSGESGWELASSAAGDSTSCAIAFSGDSILASGPGATVAGADVTITAAGTYTFTGTLDDGRIVVDAGDNDIVRLVFSGVSITCLSSAPVYVINAEKTFITLADGTENYVADGTSYALVDSATGEPSAAIFSADDLTINGAGSLSVAASYNHGIQSKDDLRITGGIVTVVAVGDGLKGRDSITVRDAEITIDAGGDGMQSSNDEDSTKGTISIESGAIDISAALDGIQAETALTISGGSLTVISGGGSANSSADIGMPGNSWGKWGSPGGYPGSSSVDTASAKGLKAGVNLAISGGALWIDSSDDAIHSNDTLSISGGTIVIASGDDGIHSNTSLAIDGGDITITKSYEGIESSTIALNDGTVHVTASDDGINAAGGNDASSMGGRPGQNLFSTSASCTLSINGGHVYVDAGGDGLDVNGPITMAGGVVVVNGPTNNGNGAIDYTGSFKLTGGFLVAAGSSGMAQAPSASSTQNSVMVNAASALPAGTLFHIETREGEDVLTFLPAKTYQSVVVSSPEFASGTTYDVYTGGQVSGSADGGVYADSAYTPGAQLGSFTISGRVTVLGSGGGVLGGIGPRSPK
jgi:hypothetical protein